MDYIELNISQLQIVSGKQAWEYRIIPKNLDNQRIEFYSHESSDNWNRVEELELIFGKKVLLIPVSEDRLVNTLKKYYYNNNSKEGIVVEKSPSTDFVETLIEEALNLGSSDIHIEPEENSGRVRYRVDGKLVERFSLKVVNYQGIVNKIKIRAKLDITEKRLPQDGRMTFKKNNVEFDIRISILPTIYGEKIVLRLLSTGQENLTIDQIGFSGKQQIEYLKAVSKISGIVLISGPTGSGKTTTLYTTLKHLNTPQYNILTIEDPVEYTLEGINQVQLKEAIGLDFNKALRTFLRQDPDIIMLGEIRDVETAKMAIRSALTGHLVLSTVHTNSAWGTVSRLKDMGIPEYLLADTLNICAAQRLVRLLCNECKELAKTNIPLMPEKYSSRINGNSAVYRSVGCPACQYTGYKGRKALFEIIVIDDDFRDLIKNGDSKLSEFKAKKNIENLSDVAFRLFDEGNTSLEEILPILLSNE
jgi:general secretion pathway protein E/type IV pilus assembly protein PilB